MVALVYDGVVSREVLSPLGPFEAAGASCELQSDGGGGRDGFDPYECIETVPFASCAPDVLIVPGGFGWKRLARDPAIGVWLTGVAGRAGTVLAVSTGSLLLDSLGLVETALGHRPLVERPRVRAVRRSVTERADRGHRMAGHRRWSRQRHPGGHPDRRTHPSRGGLDANAGQASRPGSEVVAELGGDLLRCHRGLEAHDRSTRPVDRNLVKFQARSEESRLAGLLGSQPLVERSRSVTVHLDLGEHREGDVVGGGGELEDLLVGAGLLGAELVAREAEDGEALVLVLFVKRTQTCVLRGEPSLTGDVHHQTHRVLESIEVDLIPGDGLHREVGERSHVTPYSVAVGWIR